MAARDFKITTDIAAPAERVAATMIDITKWPEWTPSVSSVEQLDPGPLKPGTRAKIRQPKLPPAIWTVTSVETGRGFVWITTGPAVRVTAHHFVEPIENGARATLSLQFSGLLGPLVGMLTAKINDRYLRIEASGLKRRCESSTLGPQT